MQGVEPNDPTPPGNLRPAQLGIVRVGRVVLGHFSATLVDLAQRGFLGIDEVDDGHAEQGWLLTDLRDHAADQDSLLRFEVTLLNALFAREPTVHLSEIGQGLVPVLNRFRAQLSRDAVRNGRLHRWHRTRRQPRDKQLLKQIHDFRRELRTLAASGRIDALADLIPYAMIFGLGPRSAVTIKDHDVTTAQQRPTEMLWSQTDRFLTSWWAVCAGLSAQPGHGHRSDFVQEWSAPHDHSPASHGHDSGHGGHGDYGDHGGYGHHGGGFHAGAHSGY